MRRVGRIGAASASALILIALTSERPQAHKPITSKYTYNDDVFPIVRDRCGSCHVAGGPAPMSLLSYRETVPWAESIREELVSERMPPWYVDVAGPPVKGVPPMTAREIDTIVTWATGGTPEGSVATRPAPSAASTDWRGGPPDLVLPIGPPYTMGAEVQDATREFAISTGLREALSIRAADLLPGTASMVRRATISVESGPVLAVWIPGEAPLPAPDGMAFRIPAGAMLKVSIQYKKPWQEERNALVDRSAVGLYLARAPAHEIESIAGDGDIATTIAPVAIVAIRPAIDRPYDAVAIDAALPGGTRVPLLRLTHVRPEWPRRYWLAKSLSLPAGSRIVTSATPQRDAGQPAATARPPRVWIDVVTGLLPTVR